MANKLTPMNSEWLTAEHVRAYLQIAASVPRRTEGEATLLEEVPGDARRILDLGSGDGRLLGLLLRACPAAHGIAIDFSPPMLERLRERFGNEKRVQVVVHNLEMPLPELGTFDVVASSFFIHHLPHPRKRQLYEEIWQILEPGAVFTNLEHVASPSERLHAKFFHALGTTPEEEQDPSDKLLDVETQLQWLREIGFEDVDCYWKWRELALLVGMKPQTLR